MPLPIHLVVPGSPVSYQSRRDALKRWKRRVATIARAHVSQPVYDRDLSVCITHFFGLLPRCDTDNISKPICDALRGIVYEDDWQIAERIARRITLFRGFSLIGEARQLALALCEGREFVFIQVRSPAHIGAAGTREPHSARWPLSA